MLAASYLVSSRTSMLSDLFFAITVQPILTGVSIR